MANEGTLSFSLNIKKIPPMIAAEIVAITDYLFDISSGILSRGTTLISHTALTAIPLGSVSTPGYAVFINMDPTHFITVYNGNGGTSVSKLAKLNGKSPAGDIFLGKLDPACVPYAEADTADSQLYYAIFSQ